MSLDQDLLAFNARLVRFLARVDGRDKGARAVAYGSDFVLWVLARLGKEQYKTLIKHVSKVKAGFGVARKVFRIGAPAKDIDAVANSKEVGALHTLKVIMHTCNGIYYSIDTIELLTIFEILPYNTAKVKELRYRFWCVKTAINIFLTFLALNKARRALDKARRDNADAQAAAAAPAAAPAAASAAAAAAAAVKERQHALRRVQATFLIALSDVPIGFFQVSDFGRKNIGAGGAGLSGCIGSLIGLREIWLQTASK